MSWWEVFKNKQILTPTTDINIKKIPKKEPTKDCCEQAMKKWVDGWKDMLEDVTLRKKHLTDNLKRWYVSNRKGTRHTEDRELYGFKEPKDDLIHLPEYISSHYNDPCYVFYSVLRCSENFDHKGPKSQWPFDLWEFNHLTSVWNLEKLLSELPLGLLSGSILDEWEDCNENISMEAREYFRYKTYHFR
jgi:hypothetical protein